MSKSRGSARRSDKTLLLKILNMVNIASLTALIVYSLYVCVLIVYFIVTGATFPLARLNEYVAFTTTIVTVIVCLTSIAVVCTVVKKILQR